MTSDDRRRVRDFLDLQEGRGPVPVLDDAGIERLLRSSRRIAVIGASDRPARPSNGVFRHLVDTGFDCVPVNPAVSIVEGVVACRSLDEAVAAGGPFDIVDVFRRAEFCPAHAEEAARSGARCLWLQLGIVSWDAARIAHEAGLAVVMDRCTAIEVDRVGIRAGQSLGARPSSHVEGVETR